MSHKYKNRDEIRFLKLKKYKEVTSYYILDFFQKNSITIIDKKENITSESYSLYILFRIKEQRGVLYFEQSKDFLMKMKVTYKNTNNKVLISRNI
jgi:hypothetical protein